MKHPLYAPCYELLSLQNDLCQQSKYYGALLQKRLGTDTIPFVLMTVAGEFLLIDNKCFFRLEAVEDNRILIRLLQSYSADGEVTASIKDSIYLMKTEEIVKVSLQTIAAIQLSDLPLQEQFYIESKW